MPPGQDLDSQAVCLFIPEDLKAFRICESWLSAASANLYTHDTQATTNRTSINAEDSADLVGVFAAFVLGAHVCQLLISEWDKPLAFEY
jgi:hypothetical protein